MNKKLIASILFLVAGSSMAFGTMVEPTDEPLANFAVAGADQKFFPVIALIKGDSVVIFSDEVKKPVAVRYAWGDTPAGYNLYNQAGLPAFPFRTGDWPCVSEGKPAGKVLVIR